MSGNLEAVIILIPILLVSISIHEMMHAFTSDWLGDDTARLMGRVTLNPLKHIDPILTVALPLILVFFGSPPFAIARPVQVNFSRVRYREFGGAIVGMVGPVTNLALAVIAALVFKVDNPQYGSVAYEALKYAVWLNVALFVVNSIPWPPLDGSRLLYAFAPRPLQEFMVSIENWGITGLVIFLFLFYQVFSPVVADWISSLVNVLAPNLIL